MHDLALPHAGHAHGHVGAVGAHLHAGLAHRGAAQAARARNQGVSLGHDRALVQHALVVLAHVGRGRTVEAGTADGGGNNLSVRLGLHDGRGATAAVAHGVHVRHAGKQVLVHNRAALGVHLNAGGLVHALVNALAHRGNDGRSGHLALLARALRAATAGLVRRAQLHNVAGQDVVLKLCRREKLHELHAVGQRVRKLLFLRGHVAARAAVDQAHVLHARHALGRAGHVHGGVAATNDHHVGAKVHRGRVGLGCLQELQRIQRLGAGHRGGTLGPGANCHHDVSEALVKEVCRAVHGHARTELRAIGRAQVHVVVQRLGGDAEARDNVTWHAAQGVRALEHGGRHARAGQEGRGGKAGRAAADHGHALSLNGRRGLQRR